MLATAIILFRETLEAALIITIILSATRGLRHRGLWVNVGILAGIIGAIIVAFFAQQISELAEGTGQEIFNASILLAATLMLGWHNVWMAKHGREIAAQMNSVGTAVSEGERHMSALAIVVGLAVLREGSEVVLFLNGLFAGGTGSPEMLTGSVFGLGAGVLTSVLLYFGLMRIPMRYFFSVTGWLILLLAAGLASQAAGFLTQASHLPGLIEPLWDTSSVLSERTIVGQVLHSLVGYTSRPSGMQLLVYMATLGVIAFIMRRTRNQKLSPAVNTTALVLVAAVVVTASVVPRPAEASHIIYTPAVEYGETEIEFRGHDNFDNDDSVDGSSKFKLDIGYGFTDRWFSEIVLEYKNPANGSGELEAIEWENIIQLTEQGQYSVDWGLLVEYKFAREPGKPDKIEAGPLMQKEFGRLLLTTNLILEKEVGSHAESGVEWEFASRLQWRRGPLFEPAIELFAEADELQLGPAFLGRTRIGDSLTFFAYEIGLLFGLTGDTPDQTLRFIVEAEFY